MNLLILGMGYTAQRLAKSLAPGGVAITGTTRSADKADAMRTDGVAIRVFPGDDLGDDIAKATHILSTAGPADGLDPVLPQIQDRLITAAPNLTWVGYLSTTGVYGDHNGGWVTEETPVAPSTERGEARATAEAAWMGLHRDHGVPVHIFRLPGIYGPGRGPFARVRKGTAQRIIKDGQVFGRIHVDDIVQALIASMQAPNAGAIYNVADDDPAPPQDVIAYAAELLGLPIPPAIPFENAEMSPMARSFYAESKRVDNSRIKAELGVSLTYPTYRDGLKALLDDEAEN